jgi:hypothetical protein
MRFFLVIVSWSLMQWSFAQDPSLNFQNWRNDIARINLKLSEQAIDEHISSNPAAVPLPSSFLLSFAPEFGPAAPGQENLSQVCEQQPQTDENIHLLAVIEAPKEPEWSRWQFLINQEIIGADSKVIDLTQDDFTRDQISFRNSVLKDAGTLESDEEIANFIASKINESPDGSQRTREQKIQALASISSAFAKYYNNSRNPTFNTAVNNPDNRALPTGEVTLKDLVSAWNDKDEYQGGICNDIAQGISLVAEKIFPRDDVLLINEGTHFGVFISNGERNYDVINYSRVHSITNDLMLDKNMNSTNLRIHKVVDGHLKEIAVVDTQAGMVVEDALETGKTTLSIAEPPDRYIMRLKKFLDERRRNQVSLAVGGARLNQEKQMYIVAAKWGHRGGRSNSQIGVAASGISYPDDSTPFQLHFRAGTDIDTVKYKSPMLDIKFTLGGALGGMNLHRPLAKPEVNANGNALSIDLSGSLDLRAAFEAIVNPNQNTQLSFDAEGVSSLGLTNVGAAQGAFAKDDYDEKGFPVEGAKGVIENLGVHLNHLNTSLQVRHRLSDSLYGFTRVNYLGSNIGQIFSARTGLEIKGPDGAQIMVFVAHADTYAGYLTKENHLAVPGGQRGVSVGAGVRTREGAQINATVGDPDRNGRLDWRTGIQIPLAPAPVDRRKGR